MMQFTKIQLTILTLLLLGISTLIVSSADAQTVHALLIIMDADSSIGPAMKVDQYKVERLLTSVNRVYTVKKTVYLSSRNATRRSAVLDWIRSVKPARDDVIFVYYGGHGGMVSSSYRETYLNLTDGQLFRYKLADAMEKVNCRLKVLITDACGNAPQPPIVASSYAVETVSKRHIKHLFGQHEGFLHLNAASEGQYSWSHLELGSFFTIVLMELVSDISDTDRDGFVTWQEVFELTREVTEELFKQVYPHFPHIKKLGRVDILLLLSWETLKLLEKRSETEFFLQNSVSFLGFYVSKPIYASPLSSYDEMSTEPRYAKTRHH